MDESDSLSEILTQQYEYYQFILSANSIKKINLNSINDGSKGLQVENLIVANAPDLNETDFACWTSELDNTATALSAKYDSTLQNLMIANYDGSPIVFYGVKNIYYGNSKKDLNLCGAMVSNGTHVPPQYYKVANVPDLTKASIEFNITAAVAGNPNTPDLIMRMSVIETKNLAGAKERDILNIEWEYADKP